MSPGIQGAFMGELAAAPAMELRLWKEMAIARPRIDALAHGSGLPEIQPRRSPLD